MNNDMAAYIKAGIESALEKGKREFIIFPFGDIGMQVKNILKEIYDIEACYILDNHICHYNKNIKPLSFLGEIDSKEYTMFLACINPAVYEILKKAALEYIDVDNIIELTNMLLVSKGFTTVSGRYSYGPLCNHFLVESVGVFCSFAEGTDVVQNHAMDYISTHPFLYYDSTINPAIPYEYESYKDEDWYFEGVHPLGVASKLRQISIGNDVWLGKNVIITNGANIGNGVIAGAGAIITKDVPDYAVVAGVPARIIRYRYTPSQIEALNKICWWNWSDEEIRNRYDDFYLPVDEFIAKYE